MLSSPLAIVWKSHTRCRKHRTKSYEGRTHVHIRSGSKLLPVTAAQRREALRMDAVRAQVPRYETKVEREKLRLWLTSHSDVCYTSELEHLYTHKLTFPRASRSAVRFGPMLDNYGFRPISMGYVSAEDAWRVEDNARRLGSSRPTNLKDQGFALTSTVYWPGDFFDVFEDGSKTARDRETGSRGKRRGNGQKKGKRHF